MVKAVPDLICYFPDYNENQLLDRRFMFAILEYNRFQVLDNMIKNANKNRSLESQEDQNQMIFIKKEIYNEIKNVITHKRK